LFSQQFVKLSGGGKMMKNKKWALLSGLVLVSMILAACAPQQVQVPVTVVVKETSVVNQVQTQVVKETQVVNQVVTATPIPPTAAPPPAAVKPVDSVVIALNQEPDTLHPLIGAMSAKTYMNNLLFVGCTIQNEKMEWIPAGCESVPTFENGGAKLVGDGDDKHIEVTFKIRKDWRWVDGTPVTTKDMVYWWKLNMDPKFENEGRSWPEKLYDVVAIDDNTAVVKWLSKKQIAEAVAGTLTGNVDFKAFQADYEATFGKDWPYYAVDPLYNAFMNWLPEHILASVPGDKQLESDFSRKPVGDGPYMLQEWKAGQELVLVASDKPFPLGTPKVKTVTFRIIADTAGVLAALQSGEVDAAEGNVAGLTEANGADLDAIEKGGKIKVEWVPGFSYEHIDLNLSKELLSDVKVRQALYMAIDRQKLSDTLYFGKKVITDLPLPKGLSWAYPADNELTLYKYDPEGAKKLLAEAGWDCKAIPCTKTVGDKTLKLEFTLMTTDRSDREKLAQIIQSMWKAINVGVNLQFLYGRGLFATCQAGGPLLCGTYDAAIYTFSTGDDPNYYTTYSCAQIPSKENNMSGQNYPQWCNQKAVDALNQSENNPENAVSHEKRLPYLKTFFKEMTNDVPVIFLYGSAEPFPHLVNWKNFKPGPTQYDNWTWNSWEWEVSK
jgi:peptide/nickel transport system substrate-binding protein